MRKLIVSLTAAITIGIATYAGAGAAIAGHIDLYKR